MQSTSSTFESLNGTAARRAFALVQNVSKSAGSTVDICIFSVATPAPPPKVIFDPSLFVIAL